MKKLKPLSFIVFHPISPVKSSAPGDVSCFVGIPDRIGLGETFRADYSLHHEFIEGLTPSPILFEAWFARRAFFANVSKGLPWGRELAFAGGLCLREIPPESLF